MEIGASSACFYPLETEKSFLRIAELGFTCSEIFFNSHCELEPGFLQQLKDIKDAYGMEIVSLHPYRSFSEGYDFYSSYKRRFYDAVEGYKRYFEAAAVLGAEYIVMHGAKGKCDVGIEEYAERFGILSEIARKHGCTVAHENVVDFFSHSPQFTEYMNRTLGENYKMVLDVKQALRAGFTSEEFIDAAGDSIVHVHLSDFNSQKDCVVPCEEGNRNFSQLFSKLKDAGYKGRYIIELYRDGYENAQQIVHAAEYLENILNQVRCDRWEV